MSFLIALLLPAFAFGHGEEKPPAYGGEVRRPGGFHVEAVARQDGFEIYLLDADMKNPLTKDSDVKAEIIGEKGSAALKCAPQSKFFKCPATKEQIASGDLVVRAERNRMRAAQPAIYSLPLHND